jgi:hypothetical protein
VFRISLDDLREFKDATKAAVDKEKGVFRGLKTALGFRNLKVQLLTVLRRAAEVTAKHDVDDWFYYQDFNTNHTKVIA